MNTVCMYHIIYVQAKKIFQIIQIKRSREFEYVKIGAHTRQRTSSIHMEEIQVYAVLRAFLPLWERFNLHVLMII